MERLCHLPLIHRGWESAVADTSYPWLPFALVVGLLFCFNFFFLWRRYRNSCVNEWTVVFSDLWGTIKTIRLITITSNGTRCFNYPNINSLISGRQSLWSASHVCLYLSLRPLVRRCPSPCLFFASYTLCRISVKWGLNAPPRVD